MRTVDSAWVLKDREGRYYTGDEVLQWTGRLYNAKLFATAELAGKNMLIKDLYDCKPVPIGEILENNH